MVHDIIAGRVLDLELSAFREFRELVEQGDPFTLRHLVACRQD